MVTYELISKENDRYRYHYYPEGKREKRPGMICLNITTDKITIEELAEADREHYISAERLNHMAEAINQMHSENEEQIGLVNEGVVLTFYASHVVRDIVRKRNEGKIPDKGISMWY